MNNNTKARNLRRQKQLKKDGFAKPVYKRKAKPFPRPSKDDMSLRTQRQQYLGASFVN